MANIEQGPDAEALRAQLMADFFDSKEGGTAYGGEVAFKVDHEPHPEVGGETLLCAEAVEELNAPSPPRQPRAEPTPARPTLRRSSVCNFTVSTLMVGAVVALVVAAIFSLGAAASPDVGPEPMIHGPNATLNSASLSAPAVDLSKLRRVPNK